MPEEEKKEQEKEEKEEEKKEGEEKRKTGKTIGTVLVILVLLGVGGGIYYLSFISRQLNIVTSFNKPKEERVLEEEEEFEEIAPVEVEEGDEEAIKTAVLERVGLEEDEVEFSITTNTGTHAKGNIKEVEAIGGGYWLAAKTEDGWVAVYDGQANPECSEIEPYDFPADLVPECIDEEGNVVSR